MYPYEAMFLVDPVQHGADPEGVEGAVHGLLKKHGAKIAQFERWDERKLAYEIKGHKRGIYLLAHFEMPGENVSALRGDCRLQESILRQLILRLDSDIPSYREQLAQYQEKMRGEDEARRGRRDEGDRGGDDLDLDAE